MHFRLFAPPRPGQQCHLGLDHLKQTLLTYVNFCPHLPMCTEKQKQASTKVPDYLVDQCGEQT